MCVSKQFHLRKNKWLVILMGFIPLFLSPRIVFDLKIVLPYFPKQERSKP